MDSEIEQLPDLCAYLKFASQREWLGVRLQPAGAAPGGPAAHVPIDLPATGGVAFTAATIGEASVSASSHAAARPKRRRAAHQAQVATAMIDVGPKTGGAARAARTSNAAADDRGCQP
jgi:hypothetical protein